MPREGGQAYHKKLPSRLRVAHAENKDGMRTSVTLGKKVRVPCDPTQSKSGPLFT